MKSTINRLQLVRLRNSEYPIFVNQIVVIILKYKPEVLHLQRAFGKLQALLPNLDKVKKQELSSELSNSLHELDRERDTLFNAIVAQVKALGKLTISSLALHVVVLKRFLDIHGRDIAKANYNAATERTKNLLADYDAKADVKSAVEALSLKILFDELRMVNTQFADLFLQRMEKDAAVERVDTRAIRAETDKALTDFFDAFEFCSSEYDDPDYVTPANELNDLIAYYKTQLKVRATRRKGGEDISKEAPIA